MEPEESNIKQLDRLFDYEDNYLKQHTSDFIFGIYEKE